MEPGFESLLPSHFFREPTGRAVDAPETRGRSLEVNRSMDACR